MVNVNDQISSILDNLDGITIQDAIKFLEEIRDSPSNLKYTTIRLDVGWSDDGYLRVIGGRPETEREAAIRLQREEDYRKRREEEDRKKFEELKVKFEGKS